MIKYLFILLVLASAFVSPAIALFGGIFFTLLFKDPYSGVARKVSKYLLQAAVVGLGFGINFFTAIQTGADGIAFTVISVTGVMLIGYLLGCWLKMPTKLSYLISSGTAICGGSAIAAVSPVVKASGQETSVSLAVIFILNAIALVLFPPIGHKLGMTGQQFGMWAAIAIHDTSSVVGAGAVYSPEALSVATTVKLTRTLWIIPLSLISILFFRNKGGVNRKISFPWFILLFVVAMLTTTYIAVPSFLLNGISILSHKALSVALFLIGTSLSLSAIKEVGIKPIVLGVILWVLISVVSLCVIL